MFRLLRRSRDGVVQRDSKDPRVQTIGASLLTKQRIAVDHERELVGVTLGNQRLQMHYDDAFRLSNLIRMHAKQAKKYAGDGRKHHSAFGVLLPAELNDILGAR
jgi:hypothetical protein